MYLLGIVACQSYPWPVGSLVKTTNTCNNTVTWGNMKFRDMFGSTINNVAIYKACVVFFVESSFFFGTVLQLRRILNHQSLRQVWVVSVL